MKLADEKDGGHDGPLLPAGSQSDLLFAVSEARRGAREATDDANEEDRILVAEVDDGDWVWREVRPFESEAHHLTGDLSTGPGRRPRRAVRACWYGFGTTQIVMWHPKRLISVYLAEDADRLLRHNK
ncbi:hypothetical protein OHB14_50255 [Streptomyces sp. NBC_01613]|uniref:hypothetical protein n=1 Tax=Streptomyces sp. NBC_01613 TaxID=2975896 RepID=UPI003870C540